MRVSLHLSRLEVLLRHTDYTWEVVRHNPKLRRRPEMGLRYSGRLVAMVTMLVLEAPNILNARVLVR